MNKLLTIVVPVYKVEQYINKCLDSCIVRKENGEVDEDMMSKLEVIIVNDGTPDKSAELSREYTFRYPETFRQIDKENGGHGSAWNVGLKEATGKYLRFLDSDDWLSNLDKLMGKLSNCDADIILSDYERHYLYDNRIQRCPTSAISEGKQRLAGSVLNVLKQGYIELNFWYATYKTEILKPLCPLFAEKVMFDDSVLSFAPLIFGRSFETFPIVIYNYLIGRPGQSMQPKVQKKNANSYLLCLQHEESLYSRIDKQIIPADLLVCIETVICEYANFIFPHLVHLSYNIAKENMKRITDLYPIKAESYISKCMKRYNNLPFILFYLLEKIRSLK